MEQGITKMETVMEEEEPQEEPTSRRPGVMDVTIPALDKYNLRTKSIQNRIEVEKKRKVERQKPREPKPKQRPAPLSKYRRKTANARERTRMQVSPLVFMSFLCLTFWMNETGDQRRLPAPPERDPRYSRGASDGFFERQF